MARQVNGRASRTDEFNCKIGSITDLSVFEEDYFYILASSETNANAVALWPGESTNSDVHITTFTGHSGGIQSISCAPKSGSFFVTGSIDRSCGVWRWHESMDGADCSIFRPSHRDSSSINTVDISPDEKCFAAGGKDHTISIWDVNDNAKPIRCTRTGGGSVSHIQFNPLNSSIFAACRRGVLIFIDMRHNFEETQTFKDPNLHVCTWQDGNYLVFASGSNLRSIDIRSPGKSIHIADLKKSIHGLSFDSERTTLAVTNKDGLYLLTDNFKSRSCPIRDSRVTAISYSPATGRLIHGKVTGDIALTTTQSKACDLRTNSPYSPRPTVTSVRSKSACECDDEQSACKDTMTTSRSSSDASLNNGYDEITDETIYQRASEILKKQNDKALSVRPIFENKIGKTLYNVSTSSDNNVIIAGSSDKKLIYCKRSNRLTYSLTGHTGEVRATAYAPDNSFFISGGDDSKIMFWPQSDKIVSPLEINPLHLSGHTNSVKGLSIDHQSLTFCSASADCQVLLWSIRNSHVNLVKAHKMHTSWVNAVRFHPYDSKMIATAAKSSGVILIDERIPSPLIIGASKDSPNLCLAWHPIDSRYLATGTWNSIRVWDLRNTNAPFQFIKTPFPCLSVNYHPSGHQMISSIHNYSVVKMYSCDSSSYKLEEISSITDTFSKSIWSAIFNSSGSQIITAGGAPGRIAVWPNKFVSLLGATVDESTVSVTDTSVKVRSPSSTSTSLHETPQKSRRQPSTPASDPPKITILKNEARLKETLSNESSSVKSCKSPTTNGMKSLTIVPNVSNISIEPTISSTPIPPCLSTKSIEMSSHYPSSDCMATLIDAKFSPLQRTIEQLEGKHHQQSQSVKVLSDTVNYLKRVVASRTELEVNQSRSVQETHDRLNLLECKVATSTPNTQVYRELRETVEKLQLDMGQIKVANAKTVSIVSELKDKLQLLTSKLPDRQHTQTCTLALPLTSGLIVVTAAVLSYFIHKKMTT